MLLLASATPSIESYYNAKTGRYSLYTMKQRYGGAVLPSVNVVDMKVELMDGNVDVMSGLLAGEIEYNLEHGEQSMLLINRRGYNTVVKCVKCGEAASCPNCSIALTYHRANGRLMCYYCGYSAPVDSVCPACGGHLKMVGFGTQRVQAELEELLPEQEILRMDADTVTATNTHERILNRFRDENLPVLVGTQMITKGLNFPNVTLVGVLDADAALYMDNFRASETTFSMISQVIGRSGRGSERGQAFLQTMTPENPVIQLAARQDYDGFYALELPIRQLLGCPPFEDLILISFSGLQEEEVAARACQFREMLRAALPQTQIAMRILGPAPAPVERAQPLGHHVWIDAAHVRHDVLPLLNADFLIDSALPLPGIAFIREAVRMEPAARQCVAQRVDENAHQHERDGAPDKAHDVSSSSGRARMAYAGRLYCTRERSKFPHQQFNKSSTHRIFM